MKAVSKRTMIIFRRNGKIQKWKTKWKRKWPRRDVLVHQQMISFANHKSSSWNECECSFDRRSWSPRPNRQMEITESKNVIYLASVRKWLFQHLHIRDRRKRAMEEFAFIISFLQADESYRVQRLNYSSNVQANRAKTYFSITHSLTLSTRWTSNWLVEINL